MVETQNIEYKSILKIRTGDKGFKDLAVTCVSLANAQGGKIFIGFDDKKRLPPENQVIEKKELNDAVTKLRSLCFNVNEDVLPILDYVSQNYDISQKNLIALGLIAQHKKLLSTELANMLQLTQDERLRSYTSNLVETGIIITQGVKKGNTFLISPKIIANSKTNIKTSLKTIEPHRLKALIEEDLRLHPNSKSSEIQNRLVDFTIDEIRKYLKLMEKSEIITSMSSRRHKVYLLNRISNGK